MLSEVTDFVTLKVFTLIRFNCSSFFKKRKKKKIETLKSGALISCLRRGLSVKCYLSDKAVWRGIRGRASIWALKSALPLGVLPLRGWRAEGLEKTWGDTEKVEVILQNNYYQIFLREFFFQNLTSMNICHCIRTSFRTWPGRQIDPVIKHQNRQTTEEVD